MKISSKNLQNCSGLRHLPVQFATHATLHDVHPLAVAASMAVQGVGKHIVHASPICVLSGIYRAGMFITVCVHDTEVAGLDNDVALKLELCTVGVSGYIMYFTYLQPVNYCMWSYRFTVVFLYLLRLSE